jgi:hypothetical protein
VNESRLSDQFAAAFGIWEEMRPYLHLVAGEAEMRLVVAMAGRAVTVDEAAALLGLDQATAGDLLQQAYRRHILDRTVPDSAVDGVATYTVATFAGRLDHLAKFERWDEIPAASRQAIDHRFLDEFIDRRTGPAWPGRCRAWKPKTPCPTTPSFSSTRWRR